MIQVRLGDVPSWISQQGSHFHVYSEKCHTSKVILRIPWSKYVLETCHRELLTREQGSHFDVYSETCHKSKVILRISWSKYVSTSWKRATSLTRGGGSGPVITPWLRQLGEIFLLLVTGLFFHDFENRLFSRTPVQTFSAREMPSCSYHTGPRFAFSCL